MLNQSISRTRHEEKRTARFMEASTAQNNESRGLTSFSLKVVAIVAMTCNHASYIFQDQLGFPLYCVLEGVGGLTFPIMAFLITEGYRYTSNVKHYMARLAVFALIAQVPFFLFLDARGNVLFTLLIGLALLYLHDRLTNRAAFWVAVSLGALASLCCDWGFIGVIVILIGGLMQTKRERALYGPFVAALGIGLPAAIGLPSDFFAALPQLLYAVGCAAAGLLILGYNGQRGRPLKWFFYLYYPAHIAVLGLWHYLAF